MKRNRTVAVAAAALIPLLAGGFIIQERSTRDSALLFKQVLTLVSSRFVDTVDAAGLYERAARGLVHELNDPYSVLFTPKEAQSFQTTTGGHYAGVGMQIEEGQSWVTVNKVFPNTPAEENGINEGDRIIKIDTVSTRGWKTEQVSTTLKGEPGTKVKVWFQRLGVDKPIEVQFTRRVIHIPAVPVAIMLDGKVGYIRLDQFSEAATDELQSAISRLQREGERGLVLDFRGNPGGYLEQALSMSNLFLKEGQEVLSVRGRDNDVQTHVNRDSPVVPTLPIVILTDEGTASASEIVAGALQDHDRALIVGTTSYGKGLVQTLYPLDGGYYLKMTTAKWFTPSGRSIQRERKVVDGRFVQDETPPDSLEGDSVKKSRPTFRSDAGRTVYGGGGITPDVIVKPDTLTTVEKQVFTAIAGKPQQFSTTLSAYAIELKSQATTPNFVIPAAWREEFYRRLTKAGITIDKKQWDASASYIDALLSSRVSRFAYGDSTAKRREYVAGNDLQLKRAVELLQKGTSQKDLFALAQHMQTSMK
jgi:carboxyl-terminal processing protease